MSNFFNDFIEKSTKNDIYNWKNNFESILINEVRKLNLNYSFDTRGAIDFVFKNLIDYKPEVLNDYKMKKAEVLFDELKKRASIYEEVLKYRDNQNE